MSGRSAERGARPGSSPAAARARGRYAFTYTFDTDVGRDSTADQRIDSDGLKTDVRAVNNQLGLSYFELETVSTRANS